MLQKNLEIEYQELICFSAHHWMLHIWKKQKKGDDILKAVVSSDSLMWQSQICVNASTAIFHNENDCTYTVITVPNNIVLNKKKERNMPCFLLHLNERNIVSIPMVNKLSFFSVAYFWHIGSILLIWIWKMINVLLTLRHTEMRDYLTTFVLLLIDHDNIFNV